MKIKSTMGTEPIGKLLWSFSWPAIIGMLVNSLYNIIDRIFVGQGVGALGIAATTVAFPIMIIQFAFAMLVGIGATALISIRLGQQKKEEAEQIIGNALTLLVLLPILLAVVYLLFSDAILTLFGASPEVLPYARDFTGIIMAGGVFACISFGMNNFIRAQGNPRVSMLTQIVAAVLNVFFNYVFIFKFGWGIMGSAQATVLSQFITSLWVLGYFVLGYSPLKIHWKNLSLKPSILMPILAIGFAPFAMQMAQSVQQTILNKTLFFYGGDLALSAVGIIMSVSTLLFMPVVGLSQGAQPIIGYNYGAKQYDRVRRTYLSAAGVGTLIAFLGFLLIRYFPTPIVQLFSKDNLALTQMTVDAMFIFFALTPVLGFQIISANYFQSVGKPLQSTFLSLSRQVLFFIPLLLILPGYMGIQGVWYTAPIADACAILLTGTLIFLELRHLPKDNLAPASSDAPERIDGPEGLKPQSSK